MKIVVADAAGVEQILALLRRQRAEPDLHSPDGPHLLQIDLPPAHVLGERGAGFKVGFSSQFHLNRSRVVQVSWTRR